MWHFSLIRILSVLCVSSALVWVASAAPVPDVRVFPIFKELTLQQAFIQGNNSALATRRVLDQFTELDLTAREPQDPEESLDSVEARIFRPRDSPGNSGYTCIIA
ncbi:hypothetical protein B0H17DRAFT_1144414 [Mycena rosella]|uniref:Uncharacterized protein n=1 Tax=Mycena rosella TaxID=1033263 RepID=A0AAD7CT61_MYCRO|nr:hypothetical protein B0H17DRAFT_1144414 [Mycena rosella]